MTGLEITGLIVGAANIIAAFVVKYDKKIRYFAFLNLTFGFTLILSILTNHYF